MYHGPLVSCDLLNILLQHLKIISSTNSPANGKSIVQVYHAVHNDQFWKLCCVKCWRSTWVFLHFEFASRRNDWSKAMFLPSLWINKRNLHGHILVISGNIKLFYVLNQFSKLELPNLQMYIHCKHYLFFYTFML